MEELSSQYKKKKKTTNHKNIVLNAGKQGWLEIHLVKVKVVAYPWLRIVGTPASFYSLFSDIEEMYVEYV